MDTPPVIIKKTLSNSLKKNSLTPCRRVGLGRPSSGSMKKLVQVRKTSTPPHDSLNIANLNSSATIFENVTHVAPASGLPLRVSLMQNDGQNKEIAKVRRCLTQNVKSNKLQTVKRKDRENEVETDITPNETRKKYGNVIRGSNCINSSHLKKLKSESPSPISDEAVAKNKNKTSLVCVTDSTNSLAGYSMFKESQEIPEEIIEQLVLNLIENKMKLEQLKVQETYAKKHNLIELRAQSAKWRTAGQEALRHCARLARQIGCPVTIRQLMEQHGFPPDLMGYNAEDDEFE